MLYIRDISPCYDAIVYLVQRFTKNRAGDRITALPSQRSIDTRSELWLNLEKISDLQQKLDKRFQPDELMLRYFSPLQTVNSLASDHEISFGELLLQPAWAVKEPYSFDGIVDFYRDSDQEKIIMSFSSLLYSTFASDEEHRSQTLNELVALADRILIKPDDKWLFIDIVLNPVQHLEKLRPLVSAVSDAITELTSDLGSLLDGAEPIVNELGREQVLKKLGLCFKQKEINSVTVRPSFLSFNMVTMRASECADGSEKKDIQIFIGIYVCYGIAEKRGDAQNPDAFLFTLKLISDPTRFQIMRELCDKRSYGQELAQSFNCTRSAMYYHLEKLMDNRLIDQQITGYRMLYTLNKQNVYDKFNAMRDYILKGWKPEDDENKAEVEAEKE